MCKQMVGKMDILPKLAVALLAGVLRLAVLVVDVVQEGGLEAELCGAHVA